MNTKSIIELQDVFEIRLFYKIVYHGNIIIPLLFGGFIYIVFRTETLLMFKWVNYFGLTQHIEYLRAAKRIQILDLPSWLLFSFPDAAWIYSFSFYLGYVWVHLSWQYYFPLISIPALLAIGGEICQFAGVIPGTFDMIDIFTCVAFYVLSTSLLFQLKRKVAIHEIQN